LDKAALVAHRFAHLENAGRFGFSFRDGGRGNIRLLLEVSVRAQDRLLVFAVGIGDLLVDFRLGVIEQLFIEFDGRSFF
jgi:hypothetical protein